MTTMKSFPFNSEEGSGYVTIAIHPHVLELITHQRGRYHFFLSIIYVCLHQDLKTSLRTISAQFLEKKQSRGGSVWGCKWKSEEHRLLNYIILAVHPGSDKYWFSGYGQVAELFKILISSSVKWV